MSRGVERNYWSLKGITLAPSMSSSQILSRFSPRPPVSPSLCLSSLTHERSPFFGFVLLPQSHRHFAPGSRCLRVAVSAHDFEDQK